MLKNNKHLAQSMVTLGVMPYSYQINIRGNSYLFDVIGLDPKMNYIQNSKVMSQATMETLK